MRDLVVVGGRKDSTAYDAKPIVDAQQVASNFVYSPTLVRRAFEPGPQGLSLALLPKGEWYAGLGHRFSQNDKTESVLEFDWRLSEKWQIGTFHRFTWKQVSSTSDGNFKRFYNMREWQYTLTRDLHDWIGELAYRVDREYGEELFLTFILKAYPDMPVELEKGYHQPKIGSQNSPFSPLRGQRSL